jgi:hypothetical protein
LYSSERNQIIAETSYAEAVRGLSGQAHSLDSVRQRATANIAIAGVATSFLGGDVISVSTGSVSNAFVVFSLILFLFSILTSVNVLVSRHGWVFHQSAKKIRENYIDNYPNLKIERVLFTISGHLEESYRSNQEKLDKLYSAINMAFLLTIGHIVVWILVIILSTWSPHMSVQPKPESKPQPTQKEPSPIPESPPVIPNPGIEEQRTSAPPKEPFVHVTPAQED